MSNFAKNQARSQKPTGHSYITAGHVRAFQAVRSQLYDNITLTSCTIDGEGGVAIVMVDRINDEQVAVMPLFVGITSKMNIVFDGETDSGESSRTPSRYDALREHHQASPNGAE